MKKTGFVSGSDSFSTGGEGILEKLAGKVVLDVIRQGLPLNRKTLSARVATLLEKSDSAEERRGLEQLLRLILEN